MKRFITLVAAGMFLLGVQTAGAQKEVEPPPIPPMLEEPRPLATPPEAKSQAGPEQSESAKAKEKSKARAKKARTGKKSHKKARVKKSGKKKASKVARKKVHRTQKKSRPATGTRQAESSGS